MIGRSNVYSTFERMVVVRDAGEVLTPDLALVRRMLDGDEAAFESFFNAVYPALYRFALARLGSDEDAADEVAQAAICKAIAKLHTFRGEAALLTWVCTFCRHEIYAYCKRHAEHPHVELAEDEPEIRAALESLRAATVDDPDASLDRDQARARSCSGCSISCRRTTPTRSNGNTSTRSRCTRSRAGSVSVPKPPSRC